jgi:hypothetical protein
MPLTDSERQEIQQMIEDARLPSHGFWGGLQQLIRFALSDCRFYLVIIVLASFTFCFLIISDLLTPELLQDLFVEQLKQLQAQNLLPTVPEVPTIQMIPTATPVPTWTPEPTATTAGTAVPFVPPPTFTPEP